jgi:hypothetical protein
MTTAAHRIGILLLAIAVASVAAVSARAVDVIGDPDEKVVVIAPLAERDDGEGFSDGGDSPDGRVVVLARAVVVDGFSDGGDSPVAVLLERAPPSEGSELPPGFIRVLAPPAPDGFSDGGDGPIAVQAQRADRPEELVTVLLERAQDPPDPPEGGDS